MKALTERLALRHFRPEDGEGLYEYLSDPNTVFFEPYEPFSREEALAEAERRAGLSEFIAVCERDTGKLVGNLYFAPLEEGVWELGYVFHPAYRGRGYATEAAKAALREGFETLGARRIEAHCAYQNEPSRRLLERLGMLREAVRPHGVTFKKDERGEAIWWDSCDYAMSFEEWRKSEESQAR